MKRDGQLSTSHSRRILLLLSTRRASIVYHMRTTVAAGASAVVLEGRAGTREGTTQRYHAGFEKLQLQPPHICRLEREVRGFCGI